MENQDTTLDQAVHVCSNCQNTIDDTATYCSHCSYPQNGTEEEKAKFQRRIDAKKRLLNVVEKEVKKSKNTLIALGVLNILAGLILGYFADDMATLIASSVLAMVYFGLAIWSDKEPFGAGLTGLIVYGTIVLLQAVLEGAIFRGIVWKILIISLLIRGLKSGLEVKKVKAELKELGIS
ncbi:zinc-ribbon domain-containing protein [Roseivirga thermotolerans]|uniref:Zinc ribbon domain-containing protein n=1 Tax=Roseivirga thermotolerans TaxID=1758176 RepID=A0ABQ3I895_9BACT|nr:zinc-ribbon domain-containing protein [Roseivirga thermotolerans]GHE67226.1 hypothetical protein GCM10011340_23400 [Roseivirga thermotolerans]